MPSIMSTTLAPLAHALRFDQCLLLLMNSFLSEHQSYNLAGGCVLSVTVYNQLQN